MVTLTADFPRSLERSLERSIERAAPAIRRRATSVARQAREADLLPLAKFLAATAAAAAIGGAFSPSARHPRTRAWYARQRKARGTPPRAAFPVVWTALYATSAVSAWQVWKQPASRARTRALGLWAMQLGFNAAWSPLFFGARRPRTAMVDLLALLGTLGAYTNTARQVDRRAAWLTAPYLAWVGYAGYLNGGVIARND